MIIQAIFSVIKETKYKYKCLNAKSYEGKSMTSPTGLSSLAGCPYLDLILAAMKGRTCAKTLVVQVCVGWDLLIRQRNGKTASLLLRKA